MAKAKSGPQGAAKNTRNDSKSKKTSIGGSRNSRPISKSGKLGWKPSRGQGHP